MVTTARNTSLEISWDSTIIPENEFDSLIFKYNERQSNVSRNNQSMYNLTDLTPGTLYTITCYVSRDGIPSNSSTVKNYTSKIKKRTSNNQSSKATEVKRITHI